MNYEIDDETRDFATTYKKEYGQKRIKNLFKAKPFFPEYIQSNPITDAYKEYIKLQKKNERLPPVRRTENPQDILNRVSANNWFINKIILLFIIFCVTISSHT